MGYVDGKIPALTTTDSSYDQWEITNSLIMGWLIHSMVLEIREGYLSMDTAQDIWEAVATTYSRKGNFSQAFELRRSIERSRVFKFLEGLNVEYDPVRGRILGMDNEESCRSAMLPSITIDRSALVYAPSRPGKRMSHGSRPSSEKDNLFCDYCRRPRHARETCWKLHGTPSGRGDHPGNRGDRSGPSRG
ncbi:hypothetical protein CsSME_00043226 [Camellia sinensis var. sinensis]